MARPKNDYVSRLRVLEMTDNLLKAAKSKKADHTRYSDGWYEADAAVQNLSSLRKAVASMEGVQR